MISIDDIETFDLTSTRRCGNDTANKKREQIICEIINGRVSNHFYDDARWRLLKNSVDTYIRELCAANEMEYPYKTISCVIRAGRTYNYDFSVIINGRDFHVEFKFNANSTADIPQFVSIMKPSTYLTESFEEFYYDGFLAQLAHKFRLDIPEKDIYLKQVHGPSPKCMEKFKEQYYKGCKTSSKCSQSDADKCLYDYAKELSKTAISEFILKDSVGLRTENLTDYFLKTQEGKHYMLYGSRGISYETVSEDSYKIVCVKKDPDRSQFIAECQNGSQLHILLRWKNGNGIAYPAFQISSKGK